MEAHDTISVTRVHPAYLRERKKRGRVRFWATVLAAVVLLAALAAALTAISQRTGRIPNIMSPGLLLPMALLTVLILGAVVLKFWARQGRITLTADALAAEPSPAAQLLRKTEPFRVETAEVDRVQVLRRPAGTFLTFFQGGRLVDVPVFLESHKWLGKVLDAIPEYSPGLEEARSIVARVISPAEYGELEARARGRGPEHEDWRKLLDCHEALGCWILAAEQLWAQVRTGTPDLEMLQRLHRVERMRLSYSALLTFVDRFAPLLPEDPLLLADRLRLALALRFRHDARDAMERLSSIVSDSSERPEDPAFPTPPLEEWRMAEKHRPPFGRSMPIMSQRRYRLEEGKLVASSDGSMPLAMLTAFLPVRGFVGTRLLRLYDAWGQHHDVELSAGTPGGLEHWAIRLMDQAPHVMELHDESTWSLGLRRNLRALAKLRPDASRA